MAITATQKILTLDYWKFADKIEVGDYVFNKDGDIVTVTKIHKYFSEDCHEVIFNDHTVMEGDKHLGFLIETPQYRKRSNAYKGVQKFANKLKFTKLEDIIESPLKNERDRLVYSIPLTEPLKFPAQCHSVPAFIFGFWFKRPNLLPNKNTEDFIHKKFQSHGYKIKPIHSKVRNMILTPTIESQFAPYIPTRIPENYLMGSVEERIELLSGIIYAKPKQYGIKHNEFIRVESIDKVIENKYMNEFFSWCVDGAMEYFKNKKFNPTGEMLEAQNEYIKEQSNITNFIEDTFDPCDNDLFLKSEIKTLYEYYCKENSIKALKVSVLFTKFDEVFNKSFKCTTKEYKGKWIYKGLKLKSDESIHDLDM